MTKISHNFNFFKKFKFLQDLPTFIYNLNKILAKYNIVTCD